MMYILVDKPATYMIEELNFCQHKWVWQSKNVEAIRAAIYLTHRKANIDGFSVISKTLTSIKVQSYPSWAKEYL